MPSHKEFQFRRDPANRSSSSSMVHRLYDDRNLHISLRQWRMLHAVVDCNGFTGAGLHLHLSQSAISYSIAKLQEQLGLPLLKIEGRKANLTEDGRVLLDRSRNLMREALELEILAENLRKGWGARVNLEVDGNFPGAMLMAALREYNAGSDTSRVSLKESDCTQAEEALCERGADLAIAAKVPNGFAGVPLTSIEHVAVAHPDHPLFKTARTLSAEDLAAHVEVVITCAHEPNRDVARWQTSRMPPWHVSAFDTAVNVLREGFAYGWLPRYRIDKLLQRKQLRVLPMHDASRTSKLYLVYGHMVRFNAPATRLAQVLQAVTRGEVSGSAVQEAAG
jgi:DNA-binding transcriptional LysR family regulator